MIIQNREEFDKEMARRCWNGDAYIAEVELDARDNGHYGTEDISHENPAHKGGYLDNFDLVKPNSYVIVNENTNEEKTILSTEFKEYGDEWYIDEEKGAAVYACGMSKDWEDSDDEI